MKKLNINNYDYNILNTIIMDEVTTIFDTFELYVLLNECPLNEDYDIILDNMLQYFVENEFYEYAQIVFDEINRRQ